MTFMPACGSQVIYTGARHNADYQAARGVCAALLIENGIPVVSPRDYKTLARLRCRHDPAYRMQDNLRHHHETDWYAGKFGRATSF